MIPVDMTVVHDPDNGAIGDCFRCCIASLLEMPAEAVPHFMDYPWDDPDGGKWYVHLNAWLKPRGLTYLEMEVAEDAQWDWQELTAAGFDLYHVLSGQSPRAKHSVVAKNGKMIHDPAQQKTGLIGPYADTERYSYGFLMRTNAP